MRVLNATDLFEDKTKFCPPSSESFWTSLFSLFLMHIGGRASRGHLTIWQCTDGTEPPWYAPRTQNPMLGLSNIAFHDIAVQPLTLPRAWPCTADFLPIDIGGFSPDLLVRSRNENGEYFLIVENKITHGARLAENQAENYPRLIRWLIERQISFDFLILQSAGCCDDLAKQCRSFQSEPWADRFGILLWEEVFRVMKSTGFMSDCLPIDDWQRYSEALDKDCMPIG